MEKLMSMTDFVLNDDVIFKEKRIFKDLVLNYATFLKQPLELWMFVPCDEDCNAIDAKFYPASMSFAVEAESYFSKYQQAKERCLFDGYNGTIHQLQNLIKLKITVENMVKYNLQLTPTAIKQIGL